MLTLSSAALVEKNLLSSDGVWMLLVKVDLPDGVTTFRVCSNTENIAWPKKALTAGPAVDKGSGKVGIPVSTHGYSTGDQVLLEGTTNYDGLHTVDATSSTNEIVFTATYTAETFSVTDTVGRVWLAFPFEIDEISDSNKNTVPQVELRVGNVSRAIQYYLDIGDGGVGADVTLYVVHSKHLELTAAEIEYGFKCVDCKSDAKWVHFTLGAANPYLMRFPRSRFLKGYCRWTFKSTECGYSGGLTTCDKTLTQCRLRSNSARFGGFPGVGYGGVHA
jgi:phage-related protein